MISPNWKATVVLYNYFVEDGKVKWYPHAFDNCFFGKEIIRSNFGSEAKTTGNMILRATLTKFYVDYDTWCKKSEKDKAKFYTISDKDIIAEGKDFKAINLEEGVVGKRSLDLFTKYPSKVFHVQAFAVNDVIPALAHIRVKCGN